MNAFLRTAILARTASATTALAMIALATALAPSGLRALEAAPDLPKGADRWRLRPADPVTTGSTAPSVKSRPALEVPRERRAVRMVYPGLLADR